MRRWYAHSISKAGLETGSTQASCLSYTLSCPSSSLLLAPGSCSVCIELHAAQPGHSGWISQWKAQAEKRTKGGGQDRRIVSHGPHASALQG